MYVRPKRLVSSRRLQTRACFLKAHHCESGHAHEATISASRLVEAKISLPGATQRLLRGAAGGAIHALPTPLVEPS